jgi:hypothetical protein
MRGFSMQSEAECMHDCIVEETLNIVSRQDRHVHCTIHEKYTYPGDPGYISGFSGSIELFYSVSLPQKALADFFRWISF